MALNLLGVTVQDEQVNGLSVAGVTLVTVRELAALCRETQYGAVTPHPTAVGAQVEVLRSYAALGPVLPAPVGVVFRSAESVTRWLELHYSALAGAFSFVENRVGARVHVRRVSTDAAHKDAGATALAAESLRTLRRSAVAMQPIVHDASDDRMASASYLVEDQYWKEFVAEVDAQDKTRGDLRFEVTGPWPPYDFVQMQLG